MSKEITIKLAQAPNSRTADFLATTAPLLSVPTATVSFTPEEDLPANIQLDSYTRDPSWCKTKTPEGVTTMWQGLWLQSKDGRGKLPGFLQFLTGRKKSCYGKFQSPYPDEATGAMIRAVLLVPYDQPKPSAELFQDGSVKPGDLVFVKYCLNEKDVPGLTKPMPQQQPLQKSKPSSSDRPPISQRRHEQQQENMPLNQPSTRDKPKRSGLLGGILSKPKTQISSRRQPQQQMMSSQTPAAIHTTSGQVISSFRIKIEQELLDFESSKNEEHKIKVSLPQYTTNLSDIEKAKVSMKVFEYLVFESAEEIGKDKWISFKEPSEFTDEAVFAVYKEGCAPADVLEDLMRGDLPDEVKQQQRAVREAMNKDEERKAKKIQEENLKNATRDDVLEGGDGELKSLNKTKRDRRSIEEIQRELDGNGVGEHINANKRGRMG